MPQLCSLDVDWNLIGNPEEIKRLKTNSVLTTINIAHNPINSSINFSIFIKSFLQSLQRLNGDNLDFTEIPVFQDKSNQNSKVNA